MPRAGLFSLVSAMWADDNPLLANPETRSALVGRFIFTRPGATVDVGQPGIPEPSSAECAALQRPVYRTGKALRQLK